VSEFAKQRRRVYFERVSETQTFHMLLLTPSSSLFRPDENDILPYLQAMGRLKDAVDTIEKSQLKSCEKATFQTVSKRKSNEQKRTNFARIAS
jgi:hypothetical protein